MGQGIYVFFIISFVKLFDFLKTKYMNNFNQNKNKENDLNVLSLIINHL